MTHSPTASARMYNKNSKYGELEKSLKDIEKVISIYKESGAGKSTEKFRWENEYDDESYKIQELQYNVLKIMKNKYKYL